VTQPASLVITLNSIRRSNVGKMITKRFIPLLIVLAVVLSSTAVFAKMKMKQPPPPNGEALTGTLYLFQKTPVPEMNAPWPIVQGGSWGHMRYNLWGDDFNFIFQGHKLQPETSYTLIYYSDPWPGTNLICLGSGTANGGSNLNIIGFDVDIQTSLPAEYDANYVPMPPSGAVGAKIWLVLSNDVDCVNRQMIGWNPDSYLFEYNLINFEYRP